MKNLSLLILLILCNPTFADFQVIKPFFYLDEKTKKLDKNDNNYFVYLIKYAKENQILKDNTFIILDNCDYQKMIDNNYNYYQN